MLTILNFFCPPVSWMTASLLTLNTPKTEFLLIGLTLQLAKINSCPLHSTHCTVTAQYTVLIILASLLMNILLFLIRYLLFLNPAAHIFVNFDASVHTLISKQPAPLLPLSFTLKLDYCNSLYYDPPECQLNCL